MKTSLHCSSYQAAFISMARAAEARDPLTRNHSERVAVAAQGIGEELGLSNGKVERLMLMCRLHNIGIIGIRDTVLLKTKALHEAEFDHIMRHTTLGADILGSVPELEDVAEICRTHHERWNGSGYPAGLKGEEIPLPARIIGVADVYVAIISERPYRDSIPSAVASDIIRDERGALLCPDCVDAFLRWFEKTGGIVDKAE